MNWYGLKIPIIIASLLAGMALFFAGQYLYQKYNYNDPLNRYLSSNQAIEEYNVTTNESMTLGVALNHEAELMSFIMSLTGPQHYSETVKFSIETLCNRELRFEKCGRCNMLFMKLIHR